MVGTIEEMTSENEAPDRGGLTLLSPYLIPYSTSAKMDDEAENIWRTYIPEALEDPELRKAHALAKAMGLSIKYVPLHEHQGISSVLFLIDDFVIATENKESPEEVCIPANTIVINTNAIKKEYVDKTRIQPYSFDSDSLRQSEHTFNIDRGTAGSLYEKDPDFRKLLDSGKFIYADGHIARNEPRFVEQGPWGHMLTPWASSRVDRCCLRFTRIYVQENAGEYVFGRMNYDADYVKQTMFYLEDLINEREMDDIEAELQYKRRFPETFIEAFDMLMRRNGDTRETMAEKLNTTSRSLYEWLKDPERRINVDFVVTVALLWRLPDWICALLLDRAYIHFSETNRRHLALQYILKVLWSEGVNKANEFLKERKLERLTV